MNTPPPARILFVTGRLAEPALTKVLRDLGPRMGIDCDVAVLGISVAALMHVDWVAQKLQVTEKYDRIILPGWCQGELTALSEKLGVPCERGPKDVFDLPTFFGQAARKPVSLENWSTEIIAEINHAPRLPEHELMAVAEHYRQSGADVIDIGCIPGEPWPDVAATVRRLVADGHRVSIDSFDQAEVTNAVTAGAELVLSCNATNRNWACQLPVEWVAIPDDPRDPDSLTDTIACLSEHGRTFRIDPILEPVGFGFAASIARYATARRRWPELPMMMGVGNVTELTEVDSAGVNMLLAALCAEWQIGSVLTTEVINWCKSAVQEFDYARRLAHLAVTQQVLPKHRGSELVQLRDPRIHERGPTALTQLASKITDPNFRIFAEAGEVHIMNRDGYWHGDDPYAVIDDVLAAVGPLESSHAFYLGYEFAKAVTALTLGKQYQQDDPLRWGMLTVAENSAIARRKHSR